MERDSEPYVPKTVIPEYLLPLPPIGYETYRKYRKDFVSPPSLLKLCCGRLDNFPTDIPFTKHWQKLEEMLSNSPKIVTDCYKSLCHVDDPISASFYLVRRARAKKLTVYDFLKEIHIIQTDPDFEMSRNRPENHWAHMTPCSKFPYLIIGQKRAKKRSKN